MGEVFRAYDERLKRRVAIKRMGGRGPKDDLGRERLRREARTVAGLNHPAIVQIHDLIELDGEDWIVMEWVDGTSVRHLLQDGPLPLATSLHLAIEILEGLAEAHAQGIVHRDLKAENVMLTASGRAKILDFGLATHLRAIEGQLSNSGEGVGTVRAVSPEQLLGHTVDPRSDLFSLGVLIYEMVSGESPFMADSAEQTMVRVCHEPHRPLGEVRADVPTELSHLVDELLSKAPSERPTDGRDVARRLRSLTGLTEPATWPMPRENGDAPKNLGERTPPESFPKRGARVGRRAVGAGLIGLVGMLLLWWLGGGRSFLGPGLGTTAERPSVAILGVHDLRQDVEYGWMATAIDEMLGAHLRHGDSLRLVARENIDRLELPLGEAGERGPLNSDLMGALRDLGSDFAVFGSFWVVATEPGLPATVHLQLYLQDLRVSKNARGYVVEAWSLAGREAQLTQLVAEVAGDMRAVLGLDAAAEIEVGVLRGTAPSQPQASALYFRGLEALRRFDAQEAQKLMEASIAQQDDFASSHAALSRAWQALGYDAKARESAERAHDLTEGLSREDALWIQGLFHETHGEWKQAARAYAALWDFFPENLEYGLRLVTAQTAAGDGRGAQATVQALRRLPSPDGSDPRIDLVAAEATLSLSAYGQALDLARHVLQRDVPNLSPELRAEAKRLEGLALYYLADYEGSEQSYREAVGLFQQTEDAGRAARTRYFLANLLVHLGELKEAESLYLEAVAIHRRIGSLKWLADVQNGLAFLEMVKGNLKSAVELLEEAVALASRAGDRHQEASIRDTEAWVFLQQGAWERARQAAQENLTLVRGIGARELEGYAHFYLGQAALLEGDLAAAEGHLSSAWSVSEEAGLVGLGGYVLRGRAEMLMLRGRIDAAERLLEDPRAASSVFGEQVASKRLLLQAELALVSGRYDEALGLAERAVRGFRGTNRHDEAILAESILGRALLASDRPAEASTLLHSLEGTALQSQNLQSRWGFVIAWAKLLEAEGQPERALPSLDAAIRDAETQRLRPWRLRLAAERARMQIQRGEPGARKRLQELETSASTLGFQGLLQLDDTKS